MGCYQRVNRSCLGMAGFQVSSTFFGKTFWLPFACVISYIWYLIILVFNFQTTYNTEHLSICLFATCVSSSVRYHTLCMQRSERKLLTGCRNQRKPLFRVTGACSLPCLWWVRVSVCLQPGPASPGNCLQCLLKKPPVGISAVFGAAT